MRAAVRRIELRIVKRNRVHALTAALVIVACAMPPVLRGQEVQELTAEAAEALADQHFRSALDAGGAAVVTVVKDGEVLWSGGYGPANPQTGRPVDPKTTLFRIGSVTKVFTSIVALQLIEQGVIDPLTNVNTYLANVGVEIDDRFDAPVTMADLLSLRAGRFEWTYDYYSPVFDDEADVPAEELSRRLWRTKEPGGVSAYDNNGVGLIGYIAAAATGKSYRDLVREGVFEPLGMTHSVAGVPRDRVPDMVGCHDENPETAYQSCPYRLIVRPLRSSGGMTVTGSDMGRFMVALLAGGQLGETHILSPRAFAEFTDFASNKIDPRLPAFGRLIYESYLGGRRAIGHDGGIGRSQAKMRLYPESGVGIFLAAQTGLDWVNIPRTAELHPLISAGRAFERDFVGRFIPPPSQGILEQPVAGIQRAELHALGGRYWMPLGKGKRALGDRFVDRFQPVITVSVAGDDRIRVSGGTRDTATTRAPIDGSYRQAGLNYFEHEEYSTGIIFGVSDDGVYANRIDGEALAFLEKIPWHYRPSVTIHPLPVALVFLFTGVIYWYSRRKNPTKRRAAVAATVGAALVTVGVWAELEFVITHLYHRGNVLFAVGWRTALHLGLGTLIAVPVLVTRNWRAFMVTEEGRFRWAEGSYTAALGVAAVAVVGWCAYWGLVGNFVR
jgi:CubicO group peptidase (beta-lactamase class C family)